MDFERLRSGHGLQHLDWDVVYNLVCKVSTHQLLNLSNLVMNASPNGGNLCGFLSHMLNLIVQIDL